MRHYLYTPLICLVAGASVAPAAVTAADLERAVLRGDTLEQIGELFDMGPEVNYEVTLLPGKEPAPLICALADDAVYGYSDEHKGLNLPYDQAEAMAFLLDNGADPNARDAAGRTPLHLTAHAVAQHILLEHGADPKLTDHAGNLPEVPEAEGIATEAQGGEDAETTGLTAEELRELGVSYAEGKDGKEVDTARAIELYLLAAERGDSTAARWMGWRYRQGRGVQKDADKANYYFSLAAAAGDQAAYKALDSLAPQKAAGKEFLFGCDSVRIEGALPQPEKYSFLSPEDKDVCYIAQWTQGSNTFRADHMDARGEGFCTVSTYTPTGKNTATVVTEHRSHYSDVGSSHYRREYKLIFTSPTGGKATCTVTGKPETIGAKAIYYTGTFSLK